MGMQQGEAHILLRQLTRRFGPLPEDVRNRVEQASTGELELWAENILDAPNLEAVFLAV